MVYDVNLELFRTIVKEYIKIASRMDGELVILNKVHDEADEYIIESVEDLKLVNPKRGDMLELTIYVDDEDEIFDEFIIGNGNMVPKILEKIISSGEKDKKIESKNETLNRDKNNNHFQKFMKK